MWVEHWYIQLARVLDCIVLCIGFCDELEHHHREFDRICISGSRYRERISKRSDAQHFELELARVRIDRVSGLQRRSRKYTDTERTCMRNRDAQDPFTTKVLSQSACYN